VPIVNRYTPFGVIKLIEELPLGFLVGAVTIALPLGLLAGAVAETLILLLRHLK
jgi:hypothetical protein